MRRNSELIWEWTGFDPSDIPGPDQVEDWMAGTEPAQGKR